jgi:hypothetical protein
MGSGTWYMVFGWYTSYVASDKHSVVNFPIVVMIHMSFSGNASIDRLIKIAMNWSAD